MMLKEVPAPVGGWNDRDSLADMPETDAVILDNWFPEAGRVVVRKGYTSHCTGLESHVETLLVWSNETSSKLIAAANGKIWDASGATGSSIATGFANNRWQGIVMNNKLALCNGADNIKEYDGTTLSNLSITGPTATSIIGVHSHKSRSYFWEEGSGSFWYSAVNTLGGTVTEFDLNLVNERGGKLLFMESWSRDAGDGADDVAVFVMDTGEVLVYSGSNPGDASDWSLVGRYMMGTPLGRRHHLKVGGDLIIGTKDGYIPLTAVFQKGRFSNSSAVSDKIRKAVQRDTEQYASNFGWDAEYYPAGNRIIFNVPLVENSTYQQHVYNTITGAWCRYKDIPARCWVSYNDNLYFGGSSEVFQAENGANDDGSGIQADGLPAYNYMGKKGQIKNFGMVQHVLGSEGTVTLETAMGVDFAIPSLTFTTSSVTVDGTAWDTGVWDVDPWASAAEASITDDWIGVAGLGYSGSARLRISSSTQSINWYATNYRFTAGGGI